uniref:3'-5' exonuclease domain-containing protein n=1 Tax=Leptobrachium leishanense TaxID=445787 RepID=A0A8C5R5U9_9ANUR
MVSVLDPHLLSRIIGKTIKLTTSTEYLQGVLVSVDPCRTIIVNKVKDLKTGRKIPGAQLFFGNRILSVELQKEPAEESESPDKIGDNIPSGAHHNQPVETNNAPIVQEICTGALKAIKQSVDEEELEYTVIDQFQPNFGPAVRHLQNQKALGVSGVGLNLSRHGKLSWLQSPCAEFLEEYIIYIYIRDKACRLVAARGGCKTQFPGLQGSSEEHHKQRGHSHKLRKRNISSKRHVYLFDFFTLGPRIFKNGIQTLLEDKSILKIIHDCRWLGDLLTHQFGVVLANVFDTQVADVYLFSVETGGFLPQCTSSLQECLIRHLNMPSAQVAFLTHKETLIKDDPNIWFERALAPPLLKVLALEVVHLLALRLVMLDSMMADFTLLVDGYLNACRQDKTNLLVSPEQTSNELPKELQQLSLLQQVKRERALKDYNVNSKGFLTRFSSGQK